MLIRTNAEPATQRAAACCETEASCASGLTQEVAMSPRLAAQRRRLEGIVPSPHVAAQRVEEEESVSQMKVNPAQLLGEDEEEPLQGKFVAQREGLDEEEPLQGRFQVAQREGMEEEEPLQGKFVAQREGLDEEEPLQGRFNVAQREGMEEEEPLQGRFVAQREGLEEEEPLQGKFEVAQRAEGVPVNDDPQLEHEADVMGAQAMQTKLADGVAQREEGDAKPNQTGMPDQLKSGIENLSGMSMDHVRVHYNSSQPSQLNALAYAQGSDIHVAPGQEQHLPHEAWHVVQQAQGRVQATTQMKGKTPSPLMGLTPVQRVVAPPAIVGGWRHYTVTPADLGGGTASTAGARAYVQNVATPFPAPINIHYTTYNAMGGVLNNAAPGAIPNPPNPPGGLRADAGHRLARMNGGDGNDVIAQNTNINRGWAGQYGTWRAHEDQFNMWMRAPTVHHGLWRIDV